MNSFVILFAYGFYGLAMMWFDKCADDGCQMKKVFLLIF